VRRGKGGRRREVGMDTWGWDELQSWLELRVGLPVGPLFCVLNGRTRGRQCSTAAARAELRRRRSSSFSASSGTATSASPWSDAHAVEMAREGVGAADVERTVDEHPRRRPSVIASDALREALAGDEVTITIVPVIRSVGPKSGWDDEIVKLDAVRIVTYRGSELSPIRS
jgi:hypothetical protein